MSSKSIKLTEKIITALFKRIKALKDSKEKKRVQKYQCLNFFLMTVFFEHIQNTTSAHNYITSFSEKKIYGSKNKKFSKTIHQAQSICARHDLHLMSYNQFFVRDELTSKNVVEWKLSKLLKEESLIKTFVYRMKTSTPEIFSHYLITLLNENSDQIAKSRLDDEKHYDIKTWKVQQSQFGRNLTTISKI